MEALFCYPTEKRNERPPRKYVVHDYPFDIKGVRLPTKPLHRYGFDIDTTYLFIAVKLQCKYVTRTVNIVLSIWKIIKNNYFMWFALRTW